MKNSLKFLATLAIGSTAFVVTAQQTSQPIAPPITPAQLQLLNDFANLHRYASANATLSSMEKGRVVFFGDSITDAWTANGGTFFPGKPYVNRGISGQTTPQMLVRFRQDVIDLHPEAVVILAGTNDIAGNTGPSTLEMIEDNLTSMAELAQANHIHVILASVLPVTDYPWRKGLEPAPKIKALNDWIATYCEQKKFTYLDYYTPMATPEGGMKDGISKDGVHPQRRRLCHHGTAG